MRTFDRRRIGPAALAAALVGLGALVVAGAIAVLADADVMAPYLVALLCWATIPIGALGILITYQLIGGAWGLVVGDVAAAASRTLPLIALLFIPIFIFQADLYSWHRPEVMAEARVAAKAGYLEATFFTVRGVGYLIVWVGLSVLLAWGSDALVRRPLLRTVAAIGAILYTLSVTFAAVDWAMSLEPKFASSAYGWIFLTDALVAGLAFSICAVSLLGRGPDGQNPFGEAETRVLSAALLGGILFWTYIVFMQYLVIWSGDLPDSVAWYQARAGGGWTPVIWAIGLLHAALPFLVLLSPRARASWRILTGLAALVLAMRFVHMVWLVLPAFGEQGWIQALLVICALIGIGGLWLGLFLWTLPAGPDRVTVGAARLGHG